MPPNKKNNDSPYLWSVICILVGALLLALAIIIEILFPDFPKWIIEVIKVFGTTITSVFSVSIIYEKLIAERQFDFFKTSLKDCIMEMDSIQSKCMKLGIGKIFESRNEFERKVSLADVIKDSPENGSLICIGKSLFYILNKTGELKDALNKGMKIEFACADPKNITPTLCKVSQLYASDIYSALNPLQELITWAMETEVKGSIELRYHHTDYPDSVVIFTTKDEQEILCWDLSFGRDLNQKRVIYFYVDNGTLGNDLKKRYTDVWDGSTPQIKYADKGIQVNTYGWEFKK
jgi:hypothetical protein